MRLSRPNGRRMSTSASIEQYVEMFRDLHRRKLASRLKGMDMTEEEKQKAVDVMEKLEPCEIDPFLAEYYEMEMKKTQMDIEFERMKSQYELIKSYSI